MGRYDDIISLPRYISEKHGHMSLYDRAAQFSPFDALTGYDESIEETARSTDEMAALSDEDMFSLNEKVSVLEKLCADARAAVFHGDRNAEFPEVTVTYFVSDSVLHRNSSKSGGSFFKHTGAVRMADKTQKILIFEKISGSNEPPLKIPLRDICDISGEIFEENR